MGQHPARHPQVHHLARKVHGGCNNDAQGAVGAGKRQRAPWMVRDIGQGKLHSR